MCLTDLEENTNRTPYSFRSADTRRSLPRCLRAGDAVDLPLCNDSTHPLPQDGITSVAFAHGLTATRKCAHGVHCLSCVI